MIRPCPVCRIGKIIRADMRTCSRHCSRTWMMWSPTTQQAAIEAATQPLDSVNLTDLKPTLPDGDGLNEEEANDMPDFLKPKSKDDKK